MITTKPDLLIKEIYDSFSFLPGSMPHYDQLKNLFYPGGILMPPRHQKSDDHTVLSVDNFVQMSQEFIENSEFAKLGFHESEIARKEEQFGDTMVVLSAYEGRFKAEDEEAISRGINNIQLIHEQDRWWVVSMIWDEETEENPLPDWVGE